MNRHPVDSYVLKCRLLTNGPVKRAGPSQCATGRKQFLTSGGGSVNLGVGI